MLDAALEYHARGWAIILMGKEKKPAVRWKPYQTQRPDVARLRKWFGCRRDRGMAVIFGEVSGHLGARDFDDMAAYNAWATAHSDLATALPTMATSRGRQVFFTTHAADVERVRAALGKCGGSGAIDLGDGELRIGTGCYSVIPPSRHPSGIIYRWLTSPANELPLVSDLEAAGFSLSWTKPVHATERTESHATESNRENRGHRGYRRSLMTTEGIDEVESEQVVQINSTAFLTNSATSNTWSEEIQRAILESLPTAQGKRHRQVFELARALKGIPQLAAAAASDMLPYVKRWHELALPHINTKPFEETWIDFLRAWPRVKFPKGQEPLAKIFEQAQRSDPPPEALRYEQPKLRLFVAVCRQLQQTVGDAALHLDCRTAGRLLDVDPSTASRWFFLLETDRVLQLVSKGSQKTRQASRYRYLGGSATQSGADNPS